MPYNLTNGQEWAECPCCGELAEGLDKIERFFGFRNMGDGRVIPSLIVENVGKPDAKREVRVKQNNL